MGKRWGFRLGTEDLFGVRMEKFNVMSGRRFQSRTIGEQGELLGVWVNWLLVKK